MWDKFVELVKTKFSFLEAELGFSRQSSNPNYFIYESSKVRMSIFYEVDGRYVLYLTIGRVAADKPGLHEVSMSEMMQVAGVKVSDIPKDVFPFNEKVLKIEMDKLAEFVRKYGLPFLKGESEAYASVDRLRDEHAKKIQK